MKKKIFIGILALLVIGYFVDHEFFMKKRVLRHNLWDYEEGTRLHGDFIITEYVSFRKDTMFINGSRSMDTLILKYQYFDCMKVMDPKTQQVGVYCMKGANWTNYLFK